MQQYLSLLRQCPLFARIDDAGLLKTLTCLNAKITAAEKGRYIFRQGDTPRHFGLVLAGSIHVLSTDPLGNSSILWPIGAGELFAETYAAAAVDALPASFVAAEDSVVLILEHARVITGCRNNGCLAHSYLVTNLVREIARKNLLLTQKLEFVTRRTTREKLMAYLLAQHAQCGGGRFTIPFNRQALADYLGVERSAMCAELSKMRKDGLIDFWKNEFSISDMSAGTQP